MEYCLVIERDGRGFSVSYFNEKVNAKIREGFVPYGPPLVIERASFGFCQAMIKEKKVSRKEMLRAIRGEPEKYQQ